MPNFEDKIVMVCAACGTASCWHGVFVCDGSAAADVKTFTVRELMKADEEHPNNWSDSTMSEIYGEPAPHGYDESQQPSRKES